MFSASALLMSRPALLSRHLSILSAKRPATIAPRPIAANSVGVVVARASSSGDGLWFVEKRQEEDGAITFVFGDEAEAEAAAAARVPPSPSSPAEEEEEVVAAAPRSVIEATAVECPSPPLSEDAAFEAMEAFSASAPSPSPPEEESEAFDAMEAFAASQKATAPPPTLSLSSYEAQRQQRDDKEDDVESEASTYPVAAVAAAIKEIEAYFSSSSSDAESAAVAVATAAAEEEEEKKEEKEEEEDAPARPVGEAPISGPAIDAAAGVPHFDAAELKAMKVADLRKLASESNIKGYSKMKKADILAALLEAGGK